MVVVIILLIKSKLLRVKMSLLGSLLALLMLTGFLISTGVITVLAGGTVLYTASRKRP